MRRTIIFSSVALGVLIFFSLLYVFNNFNITTDQDEGLETISLHLGKIGYYNNLPVYLDVNFSKVPDSVPEIKLVKKPISKELAYKIARGVFGLDPSKAVVREDVTGEYMFIWNDGHILLHIIGYNKILFDSPLIKHLKPPSEAEAKRIAIEFLRKLWEYYPPPPELSIDLDRVDLDSMIKMDSVVLAKSLRVIFRLSIFDMGLWGPGADYRISICGDKVIGAEINHVWVEKTGDVKITVSPGEALARFLQGDIDMGYLRIRGFWPTRGEMHITRFDLVYYIPNPPNPVLPLMNQDIRVMYYIRYEVNGTYTIDGQTQQINFSLFALIDATK